MIISDINIPHIDGLELIQQVRAIPQYKFTPILILTTETSAEKKSIDKSSDVTGWIVKPFNPNTLL
ncbi:Chemotaxis regulator - transmits chemoreceptor signals to flagelllar motor components CheY [Candidatus Enterovibrio altilux]|uniref:Chemotaxis regulator-transmits chemoreceptor signals to flagelllar motor components CheY n=1 Tax=Candidatus Enterovibrio altilux TaxID=1927128 RepID=A0A291B842_9GAMM|nr:Chemotaxis regulator - transmits chemoreceptor signals to flagelllar motor components CheY [Candidatus Enterovibrio luxaltus]